MKPGVSLRTRVLVGVLAAVTLIWLLVAAAGYFKVRHELAEVLDAHLAQSAAMLLAQLVEDENDQEVEPVPLAHRYQRQVAFQVWGRSGRLRLHSRSAPATPLSAVTDGFSDSHVNGARWRVYSVQRPSDGNLVQVGERLAAREHLGLEVAAHWLLPLAVALPLLGTLLVLAIGRALQPLNQVSREVAIRDAGNLEPIPTAAIPREVMPLVEQLNGLLSRLRATLEHERRFTADAAHELRTPLAGIRMQAQVARESADDVARSQALAAVLVGCDRAARLIEQLLTLARLEVLDGAPSGDTVDLARLAREVIGELGAAAHARGVAMVLEAPEPVLVPGSEILLRVLLRNLIDNAMRYSSRGTRVTARVQGNGQSARLEVSDQGPGLSPEARIRVMQRFYRVPGNTETGSGLGLSIVARIAELHGASVSLRGGEAGRGLDVAVDFPGALAPQVNP